jgi:tetratricopeptide (TPR) repeat protein
VGETVVASNLITVRTTDGRQLGPFSVDDVRVLLEQGRLVGSESASYDQRTWLPLASFPGLGAFVRAAAPSVAPASAPVTASSDFEFSFSDAPRPNAGAEPDDFDFSFSDLPKGDAARGLVPPPSAIPPPAIAPPRAGGPPTGASRPPSRGLDALFDDLPDDLPAPRAASPLSGAPVGAGEVSDLPGLRGETDLPGLRGGTDLPGLRGGTGLPGLRGGTELPGLRGTTDLPGHRGTQGLPGHRSETGLPGERGEGGLPGVRGESGLPGLAGDRGPMAPDVGNLPNLPDNLDTRDFALGSADAAVDSAVATEGGRRRKGALIAAGGVLGLALLGGVGAWLAGVGPFEEEVAHPRSSKPPMNTGVPPSSASLSPGTQPGSQGAEPVSGAPAASAATLAEVAGYRSAIADQERAGEPMGAALTETIELYGFGALEFTGSNEWARRAAELAARVDEPTKATVPGKRARLVAAMANSDGAAFTEAIELAKANPTDARAQYLAGHAFRLKGDLDQAFAAFDKARSLNPDLLPATRLAGETALRRGDTQAARVLLESVYARASGTASVATALASLELHAGARERARKLAEQTLALPAERLTHADRSAALAVRARVELNAGQNEVGLQTLEEAIRTWPFNLEAVDLLSERHFAAKNFDRALTQFETLRTNGVSTPEIVINIARCQAGLGNEDKARLELEKGATEFPRSPALQVAIGDAWMNSRKFTEARQAYDKALELDPVYEQATLRIADLLVNQARVNDAVAFLEQAIGKRPSSATIHFGVGDLRKRLAGSTRDATLLGAAERSLRRATELDPTLLVARHRLAQTLFDKGDPRASLTELQALRQRPDYHEDLSYDIGRAQHAIGQLDDAVKSFEDALSRRKDEPILLLAAGIAYFDRGDLGTARERLTHAASVANKLTAAHYYLGRVAFVEKDHKLAVQKFQLASDEEASNMEYRYWLARALDEGGQRQQAYNEFSAVADGIKNDARLSAQLCDAFYQRGRLRFSGQVGSGRDWRGAQGDFKSALDCDAKRAEVWVAYGDTFEVSNPELALQHYGKAIAVDSKYAIAYARRGFVFNRDGQSRKARDDFETAIRLDKTVAEPHYHLCLILQSEGANAAAKRACETYLQLAPDGEYAGSAREVKDDLSR